MTHRFSTQDITGKALAVTAATLLMAVGSVACSGSPLENAPFAPSAVPTLTLSAETADAEAAFGTLGGAKDKDKGKGGADSGTDADSDSGEGTDGGSGKGKDSDSGKGKDGDSGKGKTEETATTATAVEAAGAIVTVTGTCPAKTFTVGTDSFTTDAATTYEDGLCADLMATATVEVSATRQADGTLLVTQVSFAEADEEDEDDEDGKVGEEAADGALHGTVSSFRGVCPAVNFNLRSIRVSTTEDTTFVGGTCEDLRPNVQVLVTGTAGEARRTLVADTITIVRTH